MVTQASSAAVMAMLIVTRRSKGSWAACSACSACSRWCSVLLLTGVTSTDEGRYLFEELRVGLGAAHLLDELLHRLDRLHVDQRPPQQHDPLQGLRRQQALLLARAGLLDV